MEEAISERRKAFGAAHRSDKDCQAIISASRHASSVITKTWQATCPFLSSKSNPKSVYFLFHSVAGSFSSSSSSPNFLNYSSPRQSVSVFANYLRSHFSVSQPKTLSSRASGYLFQLDQATCSVGSHSSFCSPFFPAKFLAATSNLSSSTATGPDRVAYLMLKHLLRCGFSPTLQSFMVFAFLSFHLEDILYYSYP